MDLRKHVDVAYLVFEWALQDRESFLDAQTTEAMREYARREIRAIVRLRERVFGPKEKREDSRPSLPDMVNTAEALDITDITERMRPKMDQISDNEWRYIPTLGPDETDALAEAEKEIISLKARLERLEGLPGPAKRGRHEG